MMRDARFIQVLIIDDHTMVRRGLKILLEQYAGIQVVGEAANGRQSIEQTARLRPDVILMDLVMPSMDGIETIQKIIDIHPGQRIIVMTASPYIEDFVQAIRAGAQGYFTKDLHPDELVQAIRDVYQGKPAFDSKFIWETIRQTNTKETHSQQQDFLSEKEQEVLLMLSRGMTDQAIANELVVSQITVRTHVCRILKKMHVKNRVQAVLYSLQNGIVPKSEIAHGKFILPSQFSREA
jgi:two-component system, NarL family, response regulator LiaR